MTSVLTLRGLGKDYGTRTAVGAVDLDVVRGECFGLLGPNGAGKTTTISMACGRDHAEPRHGPRSAASICTREPYAAKARLGLVPQELALYEELTADPEPALLRRAVRARAARCSPSGSAGRSTSSGCASARAIWSSTTRAA